MSGYSFTQAQAGIVTGQAVSRIVGERVAADVTAAFAAASADADGNRTVDLSEHGTAILAALREISADTPDPRRQQESEQLIKTLS